MPRNRSFLGALVLLVGTLLLSCDNGIETVDVNATPPAVSGVEVENGPGVITLRWNFLDEVSPQLTFSGYKVYLEREDWTGPDAGFQVWTAFGTRVGSTSYLPLLKQENSLTTGRMEVQILSIQNGKFHSFYIVGVQNGNEGPKSVVVKEVAYTPYDDITIREERRELPDWYIPGYATADFRDPGADRIGYRYEPLIDRHYLRLQSQEDGGWLRIQKGGPNAAKQDAPTDDTGTPTGYIDDPTVNRLEIAEGDMIFVWNTKGTPGNPGDDHFSRIDIKNVSDIHDDRAIIIDCDYQPRGNTPNL